MNDALDHPDQTETLPPYPPSLPATTCGLLALARKQWAAWTGYALLVVEAFMFVALTV